MCLLWAWFGREMATEWAQSWPVLGEKLKKIEKTEPKSSAFWR
jgi:hypothetical protein